MSDLLCGTRNTFVQKVDELQTPDTIELIQSKTSNDTGADSWPIPPSRANFRLEDQPHIQR